MGAAVLISGHGPEVILHNIAGGILGRPALEGGWPVAGLGLLLQWAMSILISAIYALAARRSTRLERRWIVGGLAYGLVIFGVMNYVVVPLSAWHVTPHFTLAHLIENIAAMLLFGLIVARVTQAGLRPLRERGGRSEFGPP